VYALRRKLGHAVLVGVRGDRHDPLIADVEVLQNGRLANGRDRVFVPHWPQPGLAPRDPLRGDRIERLAYKGLLNNLHPGFLTHEWRRELAELGVEWVADASEGTSAVTATGLAWNDYREVDLVLAVRPPGSRDHRFKPASKLVNAWLAGSPALLGPDYAFRELRESELDYEEVASVREAANAIRTLKEKPGLYRAMVEHSRSRAAEFTIAALAERWRRLLLEEVPRVRPRRRLPLAVRRALRRLQHLATLNLRAR
jgi:hypothetical protein